MDLLQKEFDIVNGIVSNIKFMIMLRKVKQEE